MSLSERYQERRDQLVEYLELTTIEKKFVELYWRKNPAATRVALLISQYLEAERSSDRESLIRLLIEEAVPLLRLAVEAAALRVPDGYVIMSDQQVDALRAVVEQAALVAYSAGQTQWKALFTLRQRLEVTDNLDQSIEVAS